MPPLVRFALTGGDGRAPPSGWTMRAGSTSCSPVPREACRPGGTPLDFLRPCAIGYSEINMALDAPAKPPEDPDTAVNAPVVGWLACTFVVTVSRTAAAVPGDAPTRSYDGWARPSDAGSSGMKEFRFSART